jgi:hypothetical protein
MRKALAPLLAAALLAAGCVDPRDRRPGLWLSGSEATEPVADWSFSDAHPEIAIEVRTPYGLRHSVTIVCAQLDGQLYVGARDPGSKRWVSYVERDPNVRLGVGGTIYPVRLEPLGSAEEREAVVGAYAAKYDRPLLPPDERPEVLYFRVAPRSPE